MRLRSPAPRHCAWNKIERYLSPDYYSVSININQTNQRQMITKNVILLRNAGPVLTKN